MTLFLSGVVDVIVHFVSARSFFFGVLEDAAAFEFEGLDEVEEFLVVLFGFAGEAGDEGGADGEIRDAVAHALEEVADVFPVGLAVHLVEHVVGDVLQGNIDIAGDFGTLGDGLDEFIGPMRGVGVEEADPEVAFEFIESAEEGGEGFASGRVDAGGGFGALAEALPLVHAKVSGVLGDEIDFLHALGDEAFRFAHDGVLGAGTVLAANLWDDAEGAGVVAAFGDLDVGHVIWREAEAGGGVVGDVARLGGDGVERAVFGEVAFEGLANDGGDVGDLVEADKGIDFGKKAGEIFLESLGKATGDDDLLFFAGGVFLAGVHGFDDGADGFVFGDIDEGAGIDDEGVSHLGIGHDRHTFILKVSEHDLGVDEVLGATEGNESDLSRHGFEDLGWGL